MLSITPNPRVTFKVHFEDADLLVLEKAPNVVTQPGKGHDTDSLLNGLFVTWGKQLQNLGAARDFGLLHRLDRQTSGLLIVALRQRSYDAIRAQFEAHSIRKFYWAICHRAPKAGARGSGVIKRPILETEPRTGEQKLARLAPRGRPAVTAWRLLAHSDRGALIEARPLTGRLHQVRVHLESIGAPILGDDLYVHKALRLASPRLALHAHRLAFEHPSSGETLDVRSPFPRDLRPLLKRLQLPRPDLDSALPAPEAPSAVDADSGAAGASVDVDE
ncbi:MAG: RluA family pseudouridine synthase [Phycisphaerales bacterium]